VPFLDHPVETIRTTAGDLQGGPKSKLLHFVHIFAKYWSIFTILSPVDSVRNLLLSGMHIALIMSLH